MSAILPVLVFHALFVGALPPAAGPLSAAVLGADSVVLLAQYFFQTPVAPPAWQLHSLYACPLSAKLTGTEGK